MKTDEERAQILCLCQMGIKLQVEGIEDGVADVGVEIRDPDDEQFVKDFRHRLHRRRAEDARMQARLARGHLRIVDETKIETSRS